MKSDLSRSFERAIFLLMDGARPDVLERLVQAGQLPSVKKEFFDQGNYLKGTTVFPSTTGPAYLPFLTGCFPGRCNIPGIRWVERSRFRGTWTPRSVRSYVGIESYLMNYDMRSNIHTLFELLQPSSSVLSVINRGVSWRGNKTKILRSALPLFGRLTQNWTWVDRMTSNLMLQALKRHPTYLFVTFMGIDEESHISSPESEKTIQAYKIFDESLEKLVCCLKKLHLYDSTLIFAASDHGLTSTSQHLELWKFMDSQGYRTLYHPNIFRNNVNSACMVSGNAMAHIYLRNGLTWNTRMSQDDSKAQGLLEKLLRQSEIDQVIIRKNQNHYVITSQQGQANLLCKNHKLIYRVLNKDPFGYKALPENMSFEESYLATFNSLYPDALVQIHQIFQSERCGDMIVTAKKGFDLRRNYELPEHVSSHGSLHKEHMLVPIMMNHKIVGRTHVRTVDIFPTILEVLRQKKPDYPIDGISML